jgi:hypothetical protein
MSAHSRTHIAAAFCVSFATLAPGAAAAACPEDRAANSIEDFNELIERSC